MSVAAVQRSSHPLGAHFGKILADHIDQHEVTVITKERERRLNAMRADWDNVLSSDKLNASNAETDEYVTEELENGTDVAAKLYTFQTADRDVVGVGRALDLMTTSDSSFSQEYMQNGPLSGCTTELFDQAKLELQNYRGIGVMAALETAHELHVSRDQVFVGALLDPESILVPEETEGDAQMCTIIGSGDSRFQPIMSMIDSVNSQLASA